MSTYKELVYMVLDEIKASSDDSFFTEDHIIFLLNKYRTFLLKKTYADIKKEIPESNYQTICLNLIEDTPIEDSLCNTEYLLKSIEKIPYTLPIGNSRVYPINYYKGNITYISRDRMRFIGHNKYLQNIIYASLGPDNKLYLKSSNSQFLNLKKVRFTGIFEDTIAANELHCDDEGNNNSCDILDASFPIEDSLIPLLIEAVVKEVLGAEYRPKDSQNDSKDDLSDLIAWARRNMKSGLQKQIEG